MAGDLVPTSDTHTAGFPSADGTALSAPEHFPPPVPPSDEGEGIKWARYIAALRRYRWLILAITTLGTGLAVFATRFIKPQYTATATIWIEVQNREGAAPIRAEQLLEQTFAWVELLRTPVVLDSAALKMKLYLVPKAPSDSVALRDFTLQQRFYPGKYALKVSEDGRTWDLRLKTGGLPPERGAVGDSVGRKFGFAWLPPRERLSKDKEIEFTVRHPRDASMTLAEELVVQTADDGNFMRIALTGVDPYGVSATLNTITTQFVALAAELKTRKVVELTKILEQQVQYAAENLRKTEGDLESFRTRTITMPSEAPIVSGLQATQNPVMSDFFQRKLQLETLRRDREALEAVVRRAQSGDFSVDAFQSVPPTQGAPDLRLALQEVSSAEAELRALQFRYTDQHKPVQDLQARIGQLKTQIVPQYAQALVSQLRAQEQDIERGISTATRELQAIPMRTITEGKLFRDTESAERLYLDLQAKYEEAKLAAASAQPDVRVLSEAVPPTQPAENEALRLILMGFLASIGLAGAVAILLDQLDKRFRYPEQVTSGLGLSILGAIPQINKTKVTERDPEEAAQVIEAFRTIRLNLAHSYGAAGPILLTVSSPSPGDGKSLIASNLALSFAEAGYRTLLIDGDIRRGELHRMFNLSRRPGLLDLLTGDAELQQVLQASTHAGLTILPCGSRRHHGPELLGSPAMHSVMADLKSRYQVVIVDSPPLSAGIDPFVLSAATGNMMIVLRAGETDRTLAEEKLKLMDRLPVRILGAVLNSISADGTYRYYRYVYGYTTEDENEAAARLPAGAGS
ncbi:MAG: GumC family protein [Gemmatimonadales bacterium]